MPCIGFDADCDCSGVADDAANAGAEFLCRYLKNLTPSEARAICSAGPRIVSVFETTAKRALLGNVTGANDGDRAAEQAIALGQPLGSAIYATADFGETADQDSAVVAYLSGFKAGLAGRFKMGVYGEGAVCQLALDHGLADYTWLAGGRGMRGTPEFAASGKATIIQDVGDAQGLDLGIGVDTDTAYPDDYGGWSLPVEQTQPQLAKIARYLEVGCTGRDVATLQHALAALGYNIAVDGDFGPATQHTVMVYQRSKGLSVDGIAGVRTLAMLGLS